MSSSAEYCCAAPDLLRWAAMHPVQDIDAAVNEVFQ
jgi:hypothetical protein